MVFEWYAPVAASSSITPHRRKTDLKIMLLDYLFGSYGRADTAPIVRPFENACFKFAFKAAIDCIAMIGGVLFAALATLLFWL